MKHNALKSIVAVGLIFMMCLICTVSLVHDDSCAEAAEGAYYSSITATSGTSLLGQIHDLITTTHKKYTSYKDCSSPIYVKQTDAGTASGTVMEFYSQADIDGSWGSGKQGTWNREHVWCQSLSNNLWGESGGGSDLHHIRPVESGLNSSRGNNKYGIVSTKTPVYYEDSNNNPVALGGYNNKGVFEPLDQVKGDVARIVLYVYTHYNTYSNVGGTTNGTGASTFGTLKFTNIMEASNEAKAIEMLLEWNESDPVDSIETARNEAVYAIQGNRNPFIDHPEYAEAIWGSGTISETTTGITVTGTPTKTEYSVGEKFNPDGLTVTASKTDGSTEIVPNISCAWVDAKTSLTSLSVGTTSVICQYGNFSATVNGITVTNPVTPVDMTNLQENTPYYLAINQTNLGKTMYAINAISNNYYMSSTYDIASAEKVYIEKSGNGFYMHFGTTTKTYINLYTSGNYIDVSLDAEPKMLWVYDSTNKCIKCNLTITSGNIEAFLCSYNQYYTFSGRNMTEISTNFPAYLCTEGVSDIDPTPIDPDPTKPDPINPDPINPDPINPDPINPDPINPDPINPDPVNPSVKTLAFIEAVENLSDNMTRREKFEGIQSALSEYEVLTEEEKTAVSGYYDDLQAFVENYNKDVHANNEDMNKAIQGVLPPLSIISVALGAILLLLKQKLL